MRERQHRAPLLAFALVSTLCALMLSAGGKADAAVPYERPKATYTAIDADTVRLWFAPGDRYEAEPTAVRIGIRGEERTEMVERKDGIWVADVATPAPGRRHTFYFTVLTRATAWGAWVKAKKVTP